MVVLNRQRVLWTGFPGAPGISTFYFLDAPASQDSLQAFFDAVRYAMPGDVHLQVETAGDSIDSATGALTGAWVGAVQPGLQGTGTTGYAAPVGAQVQWISNTVTNGRRTRGRTFLVPLVTETFAVDGTLLDTTVTSLLLPAATFLTAAGVNFKIWRRPQKATGAWTDVRGKAHPARAAHDGVAVNVDAARVPDKAIVLRSRRD